MHLNGTQQCATLALTPLVRLPPSLPCCPPTLQEFFDSAMLRMLAARASLPSLLAPPLRKPLLDYLQLEKRCKKW